jgi:hypothetical protein
MNRAAARQAAVRQWPEWSNHDRTCASHRRRQLAGAAEGILVTLLNLRVADIQVC